VGLHSFERAIDLGLRLQRCGVGVSKRDGLRLQTAPGRARAPLRFRDDFRVCEFGPGTFVRTWQWIDPDDNLEKFDDAIDAFEKAKEKAAIKELIKETGKQSWITADITGPLVDAVDVIMKAVATAKDLFALIE
jgi:hypothetical protein